MSFERRPSPETTGRPKEGVENKAEAPAINNGDSAAAEPDKSALLKELAPERAAGRGTQDEDSSQDASEEVQGAGDDTGAELQERRRIRAKRSAAAHKAAATRKRREQLKNSRNLQWIEYRKIVEESIDSEAKTAYKAVKAEYEELERQTGALGRQIDEFRGSKWNQNNKIKIAELENNFRQLSERQNRLHHERDVKWDAFNREAYDKVGEVRKAVYVIGEHFKELGNQQFSSDTEGIESYSIIEPVHGNGESLHLVVNYLTPEGESANETFQIDRDGDFNPLPFAKELEARGVSKAAVLKDLRQKLEAYYVEKQVPIPGGWVNIHDKIFTPSEHPLPGKEGTWKERKFMRERIEHLNYLLSRPEAIVGFRQAIQPGEKAWWKNSNHGVIFPGFAVVDNPWDRNALYFVDIPSADWESMPKDKEEAENWVNAQGFVKMITLPKKELREKYGAERQWHYVAGDWKESVDKKLSEKLKGKKQ